LRKLARRSPGIVGDPDAMGQAALRSPSCATSPDPLRLARNLMAVAAGGGDGPCRARLRRDRRPAAGGPHAGGRRHRGGKVIWRSLATGRGEGPAQALQAALEAALPVDLSAP
jgi:hypothetical protein